MSSFVNWVAVTLLVVACPMSVFAAAKAKPKESKVDKKPALSSGAVNGQLQKTFKLWDKNKDDSVDQQELEKFFSVKLKAPPKKKGEVAAVGAADPKAPVVALLAKADADKDGKISRTEFDEWAASFSNNMVKYAEVRGQIDATLRELSNLEALLPRNGAVTAADGIFEQEARRGIIRYKQSLEEFADQIKKLDAEGHSEYRLLFLQP